MVNTIPTNIYMKGWFMRLMETGASESGKDILTGPLEPGKDCSYQEAESMGYGTVVSSASISTSKWKKI